MDEDEDIEVPKHLERYTNLQQVGSGATAIVYRAFDELDRHFVVIKMMKRDHVDEEEFLHEYGILNSIDGDCFPTAIDLDECDGQPFIVLSYIEGMTLDTWIHTHPDASYAEVATIVSNVAAALAIVHRNHIVHCDVKPAHIIVRESLDIVLLDFGLALTASVAATIIKGRGRKGTPGYMAPEMAVGGGCRIDGRTDIYSLGAVFYELLTGQLPTFDRPTLDQLEAVEFRYHQLAAYNDGPQPIRQMDPVAPQAFCTIIDRCLSRRPTERFDSCTEVVRLLREWNAAVDKPTSVARGRISHRTIWIGVASLFVLSAVLCWMLFFSSNSQPMNSVSSSPTLLSDNFDDGWRDHEEWEFLRKEVSESDGVLSLMDRGCAVTRQEFSTAIEITFRWQWEDVSHYPLYSEVLTVALKTPGTMRDHRPFEIDEGLLVLFDTREGAMYLQRATKGQIHQDRLGSSGNPAIPLPANEWHDIRIVDDGTSIEVFVKGEIIGDTHWKKPALRAAYRGEFDRGRVAIYNREAGRDPDSVSHLSRVDDFVVRAVPDSVYSK